MKIPAITIRPPWPSLIIHGGKSVENRCWQPPEKLIGQRLAIHAGKRFEHLYECLDDLDLADPIDRAIRRCLNLLNGRPWPRGAVLGTVRLAGVIRPLPEGRNDGRATDDVVWWETDQFGWILRNPIAFDEPIPARGRQGIWLWDVPEGLFK